MIAAQAVEYDVQSIVQGLRAFGWKYNLATMQAARADMLMKSTLEEMKFMEGDDIDGEHGEMPKLG
jgi:hypothetical protein